MDIRQLRYFLAIVEEGNITGAAQKLHMAQPPLSQQLKSLEDELGVKLIERGSRRIQLTDAGRVLLNRAEQIVGLVETTAKELEDLNKGQYGTLSIGTIASLGATLLSEQITSFHKEYPGIDFQIREGNTYKILELLKSGIIEIGIARTPFNSDSFESIYLPYEPMIAATSSDLYWKNDETKISLRELTNMPLVVLFRFEKMIMECCEEEGFIPKIICRSDDIRSVLLWANTGMGVAILPKAALSLIKSSNIKYKEINEISLKTRIAIIWMKNRYLSSTARNFLKSLHK